MNASELRRIRLRVLGLSQADLARRLDIHRNTLVRLETGRRPISKLMEFAVRYLVSEQGKGR